MIIKNIYQKKYLNMIRRILKNSLYITLTGALAVGIVKDDKIMDFSANLLEKFSSRYVQHVEDNQSIENEKTYINSLVKRKNLILYILSKKNLIF